MRNTLGTIAGRPELEISVIATGMHLSEIYGETVREIDAGTRKSDEPAHPYAEFNAAVAAATVGAYERGPHILDPRSGRPPDAALSVSVVGL